MISPDYVGISEDMTKLYISDEQLSDTIVISMSEIHKLLSEIIDKNELPFN